MYIPREAELTLKQMIKQFKVVLVTGARQVGKTTMIRHCLSEGYDYINLDEVGTSLQAQNEPALFLINHQPPVIIDEVQRAPNLFQQIKYVVDQSDKKGTVVLTGSQSYHLMEGVSESLAGRIGILEMAGLSLREIQLNHRGAPFLPQKPKPTKGSQPHRTVDIWSMIWRGSMPELQQQDLDWSRFYEGYIRTYLQRDVRDLLSIKDEEKFYRFLVNCAARTGQLFNASGIANDIGVNYKTVQSWLSILKASGLVQILRPYYGNAGKRMTKTPKLFFMDTGLVCHLLGWSNPTVLRNGAMAGHIFETFVVSEILKSYLNKGRSLHNIFFYRDTQKREIDLLFKEGNTLYPAEIKLTASPQKDAIKAFSALDSLPDIEVGHGSVICMSERSFLITEKVSALPVTEI